MSERDEPQPLEEPGRYLSKTTGYVSHPSRSLDPREPEALGREELELLADRTRRLQVDRVARAWAQTEARILGALAHFEQHGRPNREVAHALRGVRRTTAAVGRHLGL